ncbi:dTDP-4-dehydrorhamnose 3,5-epimerase [Anianabacter salinae]|uniref:dTDP-4-dehydrorhamnose 3,5-epimerase n=1 Tax=Anianabacter salinae TaxID=2851023 RepID=UPI00225E50F1|nr:dTDP-4-dehydrorhamnose 3,5-epimerase [Anianabacter salinae]MBV0913467.1 dTDP-4-dehydrorhamnose 3,5-epimerase [Anianabacter salinae]
MKIEDTSLPGVRIITPARFGDERGYFSETWNRRRMADAGLDLDWVQDNESLSRPIGTLRGLHYQAPPHAQDKLVRVIAGVILDVAVDARQGSPTFGRSVAVELSAENGRQLLVPKGFLHGLVTRAPDTVVAYKCSDYYDKASDGAVHFASAALGIDWGIASQGAVMSDKDAAAPDWDDWTSPFSYEAAQ